MNLEQEKLKDICKEKKIDFEILQGKKCMYCSQSTLYLDSSKIYGVSHGMVYMCVPCDAYVGVHYGNSRYSKGSVANKKLRFWRKKAHESFDPIAFDVREGWSRKKAYAWLSEQMNLPKELTHIGMFSVNRCKKVIEICKTFS